MTPDPCITLHISFSGRTTALPLSSRASLSTLSTHIATLTGIAPSRQKLIVKGKRLDPTSSLSLSEAGLQDGTKVGVLGQSEGEVEKIEREEEVRRRKKLAFEFHHARPMANVRSTRVVGMGDDDESIYCFARIVPFPPEVPCEKERTKMLERLANDPAVRDVMKRRKYQVGVLTELHPLLQPTLLGLNKNAGEEISLRLLTDDLTGTRNYATVRKVLLHELVHNLISPHDVSFNTLNSTLNREVVEYELREGITSAPGAGDASAWEPTGAESGEKRTSHTLNEVFKEERRELVNSREDEQEERRERVRLAAEKRLKNEGDGQ